MRGSVRLIRKSWLASLVAILLTLATDAVAQQAAGAREHWIATWGTAQQLVRLPGGRGGPPPPASPGTTPTGTPPPPAAAPAAPPPGTPARRFAAPVEIASISDQTVRMIVRTSVGGRRARIRISNAFGSTALAIGAAHIAQRREGSAIVTGTDRPLTFGGKTNALVYAGQVLTSDPVDLVVPPLADMAVTLYIPGDAVIPTSHRFGLRPTYISTTGNFAGAPAIDSIAQTTESYYWLAGLDVVVPADGWDARDVW